MRVLKVIYNIKAGWGDRSHHQTSCLKTTVCLCVVVGEFVLKVEAAGKKITWKSCGRHSNVVSCSM